MLLSATVSSGGTGYAVGERVTVSGGIGDRAVLVVTAVTDGVVQGVEIYRLGNYSVPPPLSGAPVVPWMGSGLTLNLTLQEYSDKATVFPKNGGGAGRWIRQIDGNMWNVKWFGAKGDGTTDDSEALQNAINSKKTIFLPKGIYHLTKSLTYIEGFSLRGENKGYWAEAYIRKSGTSTEPLLHQLGGWLKEDGKFTTDGINEGPLRWGGGGDGISAHGIRFGTLVPFGTCIEIHEGIGHSFINCKFAGYRAFTMGLGAHDVTLIDCQAAGPGFGAFTEADFANQEPMEATLLKSWGFYLSGQVHAYMLNCKGCYTGIYINGQTSNVFGARIEVCAIGIAAGYGRYNPAVAGHFESYPWQRGLMHGISMEACWIGITLSSQNGCSINALGMQGSETASGRPYAGRIGIECLSGARAFTNVTFHGSFSHAEVINNSQNALHSSVLTKTLTAGVNRIFGGNSNETLRAQFGFIDLPLFPNALENGNKKVTAFSNLMMPGLTGLNIRDVAQSGSFQGGPIFARNLGGVVTPASGVATAAVAFEGSLGRPALTIQILDDGLGTLPSGTYYYAGSRLYKNGETGVNYGGLNVSSHNEYKSIDVTYGQRVSISTPRNSRYKVRLYRGIESSFFSGYWEFPVDSVDPFIDDGRLAFTSTGFPPNMGMPGLRSEDDANYEIVATPSWATTVHVTKKTNTGFTLNFGSAAPDNNQTVSWLLFRP